MASVVCASHEIEPKDMAPPEKRLTISAAGSTSSSGIGLGASLKSSNARSAMMPASCSPTLRVYSLNWA